MGSKKFYFFLGGADAEMVEIRNFLTERGIPFSDAGLGWGAAASDYGDEIAQVVAEGFAPVLVELEVDVDLPEEAIIIDHHGDLAGKPASLLQVLAMYDREPTHQQALIAANDSAYIPGMLAMGATPEEIATVRLAERVAQGITEEQEAEAERAIQAADAYATAATGALVVIELAHSKCATVTDRLFPHWPDGRENLLILSGDGEVNFYGDGAICAALAEKYDGSWSGGFGLGTAGENAFWGGYPDQEEVLAFIKERLA